MFAGAKVAGRQAHKKITEDSAAWRFFFFFRQAFLSCPLNYRPGGGGGGAARPAAPRADAGGGGGGGGGGGRGGGGDAGECVIGSGRASFSTPEEQHSKVHFLVRSFLTGASERRRGRSLSLSLPLAIGFTPLSVSLPVYQNPTCQSVSRKLAGFSFAAARQREGIYMFFFIRRHTQSPSLPLPPEKK